MNSSPSVPPSALRGSVLERGVLVFVLLALGLLVSVPILVEREVDEQRQALAVVEPARTTVSALESNLVREMLALSELLLTRDTAAAIDYDEALLAEDSLYRELDEQLPPLGGEVMERYAEVRKQALLWHDRAPDASDLLEDFGEPADSRPRRERRLFQQLSSTTRSLDTAITTRAAELRASIEATERVALTLTFALGFLALIAGMAAALLAGRSRRYALESERRRIDAEIALERLARESELRQRLLRGITHDVKNPLGAAKGYAELLAMGVKAPILPEQVPLVTGLQRSVDGALEIIADLLDVARADSGRISIDRVAVDLTEVVTDVVEVHRAQAEAAGHTIRFARPQEPLRVYTDPVRVKQILQNLISNAVKYTPPPGRIEISAKVRNDREGETEKFFAVVRVKDSGPGIPPNMRERIFDEFSRLSEDGAVQGHGLGLAIARRLARLLGGDLVVDPTDPPGASFALRLPVRDATPSQSAG